MGLYFLWCFQEVKIIRKFEKQGTFALFNLTNFVYKDRKQQQNVNTVSDITRYSDTKETIIIYEVTMVNPELVEIEVK